MATPIYLGTPSAPMLGWLHRPAGPGRDTGIVICPPVGSEYGCTYHLLRVLAERLAAAGFPVLRFDYQGAGDSSGSDTDPGRVGAWLDSIRLAADELKRRAPVANISLLGVRLGGLLAYHAAAGRSDVASIVSWWGVGSGKKYVRNLRLYGLAATGSSAPATGGEVESGGYVLAAETLEDLARLDPAGAPPAIGTRTLFIQRDDQPLDEGVAAKLTASGRHAEVWSRAGIECIGKTPHESTVPEPLVAELVAWLVAQHAGVGAGSEGIPEPVSPGDLAILAETQIPFEGHSVRESVVRFGPELVGVVSHPVSDGAGTGILILPGSSGHRVGTHRISVPIARDCAVSGYVAMRFELGGNGDSPAPPGAGTNEPFPTHAAANIRSAVEAMRRDLGVERVIVLGHCAGAWATYRAAVTDAGADEYILLNWMNFYATPGANTARDEVVNYREVERLKGSVRSAEKWRRLLTGKTSPAKVAGIVWRRAAAVVSRMVKKGHGRLATDPGVGGELVDVLSRARFTLIFSHALGPTYFKMQAGALLGRLERNPGFRLISLTSEDLGFGTAAVRRQLFTTLRDHLAERYPAPVTV